MSLAVHGQVLKWNFNRVNLYGVLFRKEETVLPYGVHMVKPYSGDWNFSSLEKFLLFRWGKVFVVANYDGNACEARKELDKFCDMRIPIIVRLENREYLLGNPEIYQSFYDALNAELSDRSPKSIRVMEEYGNSNFECGIFKVNLDETSREDLVFDGGSLFSSIKTLIPLEQLRLKLDNGEPLNTIMPDGKVEELPNSDANLLNYLRQYGKVVIVGNKPDNNFAKLLMLVFDGWKFYD